jgi:hypothetical protein
VNKERLEHLIEVLTGVKEKGSHFDMASWFFDCGTPACALGYAAVDPEFVEQGLRRHLFDVDYAGYRGYSAAQLFFELSWSGTRYIFSGTSYCPLDNETTAMDVIDHIRQVMARYGTAPPHSLHTALSTGRSSSFEY